MSSKCIENGIENGIENARVASLLSFPVKSAKNQFKGGDYLLYFYNKFLSFFCRGGGWES